MKVQILEMFHSSEGTEIRMLIQNPVNKTPPFHKTGVKAYGEWCEKAGIAQDIYKQEVTDLLLLHLGEAELTQDGPTPKRKRETIRSI